MKYKYSPNAFVSGLGGWIVYDERGTLRIFLTEYMAAQYVRRHG